MSNHSQLSLGPMEGKAVVRASTTVRPHEGQVVVPEKTNGLSLLIEAVDHTCSDKEAQIALGLPDPTYWSKVKGREKPAPRIDRLTDLPEQTQREMCKRWGRQLKMTVSDEDTRRQVLAEVIEAAARAIREIA